MSVADSKMLSSDGRDLIIAIKDFTKKLEKVQITSDIANRFLKAVEGYSKLPSKCDVGIVDSFLVSLVSILSINTDYSSSVKALESLFTFLKNDPQVYARFKPDKTILMRINLDPFVSSKLNDERNLALNFTSFLLRYHQDLDYTDFSEDESVIRQIKRAEMYRNWVDIEDLATGYETLQKSNSSSGKAFQEILALIDNVKGEMNEKVNLNHEQLIQMGKGRLSSYRGQAKADVHSHRKCQDPSGRLPRSRKGYRSCN